MTELIEAILSTEVDFVLNNLVGETSYAFLRALDEARLSRSADVSGAQL